MPGTDGLETHLRRQHGWYREWWTWLLERKVLPHLPPRPTALDVGCGPGLVMQDLSQLISCVGLDVDRGMARACASRGFPAVRGDGRSLPFPDRCFDLVLCSFTLLWVRDPVEVVREMARASRGWVACLAEPDYLARVDHPPSLDELTRLISAGAQQAGADPAMGRQLRSLFARNGMEAEVGVIPDVWSLETERAELEGEWAWATSMMPPSTSERTRTELRAAWQDALDQGSLLRFNPTFYALARRP